MFAGVVVACGCAHPKQQQAKNDKDKQKPPSQNDEDKKQEQPSGEGESMQVAQMTPEQAKQFLDGMKQDDKALIFTPPKPEKQSNRRTKDW